MSQSLYAAISVEGNSIGGACTPLVFTLKSRWTDVRDHMLPVGASLKDPKKEDFICISRNVVRNSVERRIVSGANIKCFSPHFSKGLGVCCDNPITTCTQLHPGLFPELHKKPGKQEAYKPPKSNWVRPPSDNDQWNSN